jgi:hypothetical protein
LRADGDVEEKESGNNEEEASIYSIHFKQKTGQKKLEAWPQS